MRTLVLVRHAKSDWGDPSVADHDRPLDARGLHDAPVMAARLAATGFRPDVLLSSTAVRARTTADAFAATWGMAVGVRAQLYGASADVLWRTAVATGAHDVLVVAHNPGVSVLAGRLSGGVVGMLPTCAVATFRWDDGDAAGTAEAASFDVDTPRG